MAQLSRKTGLHFINLGCSGHSTLQSYFAEPLADADVDAFLFDAFSNPTSKEIEERLFPFIEIIQEKNPGDYGYRIWADSIKEPVTEILASYGIR